MDQGHEDTMMGSHPGDRVTACSVGCSILEYLMEMMRRVKVCEVVPGLDLSGPSTVWSVVAGFSPLPWCLVRGKSLNQFQVEAPTVCEASRLVLARGVVYAQTSTARKESPFLVFPSSRSWHVVSPSPALITLVRFFHVE
ncbi:hypothetical protein Bca52824_010908 [Brassica carinata]|uniref:Uncharacterized protein n=1 Tax=Brassica carinata TaxID=52824 RepID=A0A8X8BAL5_BRACI|nr:hypothetical protein Bca52824_010908 [Brassica carinata]